MAISVASVCELCANVGFSSFMPVLVQVHASAANPEVLGLHPSFPQFYIGLGFLLLTVNANGDSYRCNLS